MRCLNPEGRKGVRCEKTHGHEGNHSAYKPTQSGADLVVWARLREFGVFEWQGDVMYRRETALKVYKSRPPAERYASASTGNLVVREIT